MFFLGVWQSRRDGARGLDLPWFSCLLLLMLLALAQRTSAGVVRSSESSSSEDISFDEFLRDFESRKSSNEFPSLNNYDDIFNNNNSVGLVFRNSDFNYPNIPAAPKFEWKDLPTPPTIDWSSYETSNVNTSAYSYSGGRILFIPIGAILFLISLCLRMCICSTKKPVATTITVVRRTVVIPVEGRPDVEEGADQPPSYADVQKEDSPPPYSEVCVPASDTAQEATEQPTPSSAKEGAQQASTAATPSAPEETSTTNVFSGRPRFLQSQYSYKPLE